MPLPNCTTSNKRIMSNKRKREEKKKHIHPYVCFHWYNMRARIVTQTWDRTQTSQLTKLPHWSGLSFNCVAVHITAYAPFSARTNYLMNELQTTDNWSELCRRIDATPESTQTDRTRLTNRTAHNIRARSTTLVFLRKSMCSHTHTRFCVRDTFLLIYTKILFFSFRIFFSTN